MPASLTASAAESPRAPVLEVDPARAATRLFQMRVSGIARIRPNALQQGQLRLTEFTPCHTQKVDGHPSQLAQLGMEIFPPEDDVAAQKCRAHAGIESAPRFAAEAIGPFIDAPRRHLPVVFRYQGKRLWPESLPLQCVGRRARQAQEQEQHLSFRRRETQIAEPCCGHSR